MKFNHAAELTSLLTDVSPLSTKNVPYSRTGWYTRHGKIEKGGLTIGMLQLLTSIATQRKTHNLSRENNVLLPTLFNVVNIYCSGLLHHVNSRPTMLNNILYSIRQCWQQNIVQCCFQQP